MKFRTALAERLNIFKPTLQQVSGSQEGEGGEGSGYIINIYSGPLPRPL